MNQSPIDIRAFRRALRALERQIELSLATETERTLYFDFLPLSLG